MNIETARILGRALLTRSEAARVLCETERQFTGYETMPKPAERVMLRLAEIYVHESRIINRIISEDTDGGPE